MGQNKINKEVIGREKTNSEDQAEAQHKVDFSFMKRNQEKAKWELASEVGGKAGWWGVLRQGVCKVPFQMWMGLLSCP